jgi:hypothetical protein
MRQTAMLILANIVSVFANQVMAASMEDKIWTRAGQGLKTSKWEQGHTSS